MQDQQAPSATEYQFGGYRLDTRRQQLSRGGGPLSLEPKAFDVLCLLIEHRDRLVTKEELLDTVWRGTFVAPNVLTRAIAQIRKTLGDDARESRFIETATTRGYRFIHPVDIELPTASSAAPAVTSESRATPAPVPAGGQKSITPVWSVLALAGIVLLGAAAWFGPPGPGILEMRRCSRGA